MNRKSPIYASRSSTAVMEEIERLCAEFKSSQKRGLPANLLSFSTWHEGRGSMYGVSLMWEDSQASDAQWVKTNVTQPTTS